MKIMNRLNIFIFAFIGLSLVVTLFQPDFYALAVGNSVTSVSAPAQPVNSNQQFSVSIMVQPNNPISGAQFNLSFNPSLATINSITEGNLFNQNGASTYFFGGTINNTAGTVSGVADAIIGAGKNVSASGSLAVINMTARTTGGTSALNLSNVILADANGLSAPVTIVNGQVVIKGTITTTSTTTTPTTTYTTTTTVITTVPTTSPAPPSGGGGSGGGGVAGPSAPTSVAGVMDISNIVNTQGVFSFSISPWSDDKKTVMVINNGTMGLTSSGTPLTQISIQHLNIAPAFPTGAGIVSLGYNFLPSDAKISPSPIVRFQYDPTLIPPDVLETSLQIAYFDTIINKWVSLPSEVDINNHFITTQISYFAFYAVTYGVKNMAAAPTTVVPSVTPTTNTTTLSTTVGLTTPSVSSAPAPVTSATTELTKPTATSMPVLPVSPLASNTTTQAPRVVRLSLLAITIGVDAILIIGVIAAIVFIRRKLRKND